MHCSGRVGYVTSSNVTTNSLLHCTAATTGFIPAAEEEADQLDIIPNRQLERYETTTTTTVRLSRAVRRKGNVSLGEYQDIISSSSLSLFVDLLVVLPTGHLQQLFSSSFLFYFCQLSFFFFFFFSLLSDDEHRPVSCRALSKKKMRCHHPFIYPSIEKNRREERRRGLHFFLLASPLGDATLFLFRLLFVCACASV